MQRLEVSGAVRPIYGSLGVKRLNCLTTKENDQSKQYTNTVTTNWQNALPPSPQQKILNTHSF